MAARKPTRQTIAFGQEVIRLRQEKGLSRLELAERATVSRSYIAQVENGTTRCRRDFTLRLDNALGTETTLTDTWDDILKSSAHPKFFTDYSEAEATAELLRMYAETFIVGLFQTNEYAQVLLPSPHVLESRMKRQQILERETPPRIIAVLAEVVLSRQVGAPEVMFRQHERLLEISEWEHVTLQIAPTAYYRGVSGTFSLATQPTGEELLYQELSTGGFTSQEAGDILHCVGAFAEMQARCLSVSDSRDFIRKAMDRWTL
ncbi:helix-turn-helix domain-containing protein [Actinomadura citrea]|uniref:helix-turn-helix domain-containing protein n=1 Tax=Actinomadura citrea TaxID=46158 RepID=UPI002E28C0BD|nr:helix-turn-helix transcriptional regulator [Actinomadura citrea]